MVLRKAFQYSSRKEHDIYDAPEADVHVELGIRDTVMIGSTLNIKVGVFYC